MKFLFQEEKTRQELEAWAESDGKRLILVRFFFWGSGDQLQKSTEGLSYGVYCASRLVRFRKSFLIPGLPQSARTTKAVDTTPPFNSIHKTCKPPLVES